MKKEMVYIRQLLYHAYIYYVCNRIYRHSLEKKGGKRNLVKGNQIHFVFQLYQEESSDINLCEMGGLVVYFVSQ